MRIRGNKEFYAWLHQIERAYEDKGETFFTVKGVRSNNPTLKAIRQFLSADEDVYIQANLNKLKQAIRQSDYFNKDIAKLIGIAPNTFGQKLGGISRFTNGEVNRLEEIFNLKEGELRL